MSWDNVTLKDVSTDIQTGPFGSQLHQSDYSENGTPVVMPKDLQDGHVSIASIARVDKDHVERLSKHKIKPGDILYSRRGDVGRCAFATMRESDWLCGTGCLRVTINPNMANPKFIFYQLQKPETIGWVEKHAVGATMLNLNTTILGNIPLSLPPLSIQNQIADYISAYDDLIENNRRQIKLLEEAARRLYREWFVDFRFPGHEQVKIVDGVPEGWKKVKLSEIVEVRYGKDHKSIPDGDIPVYGSGGLMRYCAKSIYEGESVLIPRKGTLNNILYVDEPFWTVDTMFYTILKMQNIGIYIFQFLSTFDFYSMNTGAAVPSTTAETLKNMETILPDIKILKCFDCFAKNIYNKTSNLQKGCTQLSNARDMLLYKML